MPIKSPYNFAPAPEEKDVFKPDWANQVSHDMPFQDGSSGTLDFTLTAVTPIFIRNGASRIEGNEKETHFSHRKTGNGKEYFIPGSSIKGMVRNVLAIMAGSRLQSIASPTKTDRRLYGLRDMDNKEYSDKEMRDVKSGWLRKVGNSYFIFPCDFYKIKIEDIERKLSKGISLRNGQNAVQKSEVVGADALSQWREFRLEGKQGKQSARFAEDEDEGVFKGRVVVYGDIETKQHDYVFTSPKTNGYVVSSELMAKFELFEEQREVMKVRGEDGKETVQNFSLLHFYRSSDIKDIPVFYKLNEAKKQIIHFGFSRLYRLNDVQYLRSIHPFNVQDKEDLPPQAPDLAELIFGFIQKGEGKESLKGRVHFSHAFSKNAVPATKTEVFILSSPKPSFYPAYLRQGDNTNTTVASYNTYRSENATVRGFKRYPIHLRPKVSNPNVGTENMEVPFIPLQAGASFKGRLVYHNLKPVELGALLSALTFHHNAVKCYHTLGMAKPYGFGKVRVDIAIGERELAAMQAFEFAMDNHKAGWLKSDAVTELFAMSQPPKDETANALLTYPKLTEDDIQKQGNQKDNEFRDYKENKLILEKYSARNGLASRPESLVSAQVRGQLQELHSAAAAVKNAQQQEREAYDKQRQNTLDKLLSRQQDVLEKERETKKGNDLEERQSRVIVFQSFAFNDVKAACNEVKGKLKTFEFSDAQKDSIIAAIEKSLLLDANAFRKKSKPVKFSDYPWTDIRKWVGDVQAKKLYERHQ